MCTNPQCAPCTHDVHRVREDFHELWWGDSLFNEPDKRRMQAIIEITRTVGSIDDPVD